MKKSIFMNICIINKLKYHSIMEIIIGLNRYTWFNQTCPY